MRVGSSQGVEIQVHDLGGEGPVLVMAHATGLHGMVWKPLADSLSDRFHCFSLDFRAHGTSTLPEGADLVWEHMADDVLAVLDAVSPDEPVRTVGHSMGGGAIAIAAARRPERFAAAWAFEPILLPTGMNVDHSPISAAAEARRPVFESREAALANYASKPPLNSLHPDALFWYVEHGFVDQDDGTVRLACEPIHEATVFRNASAGADQAALDSGIPFAVVAGNDGGPPAKAVRAVAERAAPGHGLTLVEMGLGHFGPLVEAETVAAEVTRWFDSQ